MKEVTIMALETIAIENITYLSDRMTGGMGELEQLAESIKQVGLIHPIVLTKNMDVDSYHIVAGLRRFEAVKTLEWEHIPAFVIDAAHTEKATAIALSENVNRLDMHPLDEAIAFKRLEDSGMSVKDIARYYARSVSGIYQRLRLCELIAELQSWLRDGKLSLAQAAMLASLAADQQQAFLDDHKGCANGKNIPNWAIENFLHKVQRNTLDGITFDKCATCSKRTKHSDHELFPEFDNLVGVCFDDHCYRKAWRQTLAAKIAAQSEERRLKAGNYLIRNKCVDELFGKDAETINLDGKPYTLLDVSDYALDNSNPDFWAWMLPYRGRWELALYPYCRKGSDEAEEEDLDEEGGASPLTEFIKALNFAGVPDEKRQRVAEDLCEMYPDQRVLVKAIQDAALCGLIARHGELERGRLDKAFLAAVKGSESSRIFRAYAGADPSAESVSALTTERIPNILMVKSLNSCYMPSLYAFEDVRVSDDNPYLQLFGLSVDEFSQIYKDTTAELMENAAKTKPEAVPEEDDYAEAQ